MVTGKMMVKADSLGMPFHANALLSACCSLLYDVRESSQSHDDGVVDHEPLVAMGLQRLYQRRLWALV